MQRCSMSRAKSRRIIAALRSGNKLLIVGNGGSAADAQHIAAEIVGRYKQDRPGYAALALTTDTSALTSIATITASSKCSRGRSRAWVSAATC